MPVLQNREVIVELDERFPRTVRLTRRVSGASLAGCEPERPFALELNGRRYEGSDLECRVEADASRADYVVSVPALGLALRFRFALDGTDLVLTIPEVRETGTFRLEKLYVPDHRLVTGSASAGDCYLRHVIRRTNWGRHWCPGAPYYDMWEDLGPVGGAPPELGAQRCLYACVWNEGTGICAGVSCSIYVEPLVTALDAAGSTQSGRAGTFSLWAGTYSHRLRGRPGRPFEFRIGILGDHNRDGKVDWCDAAAWEQDRLPAPNPLYREVIAYKVFCDDCTMEKPLHTFDDCLNVIRQVHEVSGGLKQIVYVVGWQHEGHDTGYPSHAVVKERLGGLDGLRRLIEDARTYNCTVSLHANVDDAYPHNPEFRADLLARDRDGHPLVWFDNPTWGGGKCYSINHTLSIESGYEQDRCDRLCAMLPLRETIHFDAFRCCGEVWLPDGTHIDAECEVQRGMIPIMEMYAAKGLDVTTEGGLEEGRALFSWVWLLPTWQRSYHTVVMHGRVPGHWRTALSRASGQVEKRALGEALVYHERGDSYETILANFYLNWMYAQIMARKRVLEYRVGDWDQGLRAHLADDTWVEAHREDLTAQYEGIPIARGTDRFLPWREDIIYAFSVKGGPQEWTLPASWAGARITAAVLDRGRELPGPQLDVAGRRVAFSAPAGLPVRLRRTAGGKTA